MGQVRQVLSFATNLYGQRAATVYAGYVRREQIALLQLKPGRDNPYAIYERLRRLGTMSPTPMGNWATTSHRLCSAVLRDRRFGVRPEGGPSRGAGEFDLS
ncbi:MAG TPA: hypothetical protein VGJ07_23235 [Rugosimonospora sp.]